MVLLGYEEGIKAYRLYDPRGGKVVVSRDIVFNEKAAWDWDSPGMGEAGGFTSTFVVEHLVIHGWWRHWRGGADHFSSRAEHSWAVPSTPRVTSSGPIVVPTTLGLVLSAPVAEPSSLAVVPTTPRLVLSTPAVCRPLQE